MGWSSSPDIEFQLLGSVRLLVDGGEVSVAGRRRKALLAFLLLHPNQTLAIDRIAEAVWDGAPPRSAAVTVPSHVSLLRRVLGDAARVLVTRSPGYALEVAPACIDWLQFEDLAVRGRAEARAGDHASALRTFEAALGLWRGRPMADLAGVEFAEREGSRLEEVRLGLIEARIDSSLALGRHDAEVGALTALVDAHPLRERPVLQLALALYRGGRQSEALRAIDRSRRRLRDELGLEACEELRELEAAILRHDADLDPGRRTDRSSVGTTSAGGRGDDSPPGTVTFVFSDVVNSTELWERHADAMVIAVAEHDRILRRAIERRNGQVFSTAGDSVGAAFRTPLDGLIAAVEAQRRLNDEPWGTPRALRVRMAMHTGTAHERDGNYFGSAVNRTARLMGLADGGQVLVSEAAAALLRDQVPGDVELIDLGAHRLGDPARAERVFQVSASGLPTGLSTLRAAARMGSLPLSPTAFIGRHDELSRLVVELSAPPQLVTLIGAGGVGKTRLALAAARAGSAEFPDGVWWCDLAPVADAADVTLTVATALSVRPQEGLSMVDSVVDGLRARRVLIVLDNCEHVLGAAADLSAQIRASCTGVSLLATSRQPLEVAGERVWRVRPLASNEAVELFCERARSADVEFAPGQHDLALVAAICDRLDGIPLAVELAAARVPSMALTELLLHLDDRFRLLRGSATTTARHRTLHAAVEWSHQLLEPPSRRLFDRLSVFAGGFDQAAVEAVCVDEPRHGGAIAELLSILVDRSMLVADRTGARTRYRLLETLRQFGQERLHAKGDLDRLRDRHLAHVVETARCARRLFEGTANLEGAALFRAEWDNLRAAVRWAVTIGDTASAGALVESMFWFACFALRHELGEWALAAQALPNASPALYGVAALFSSIQGDHGQARRLAAEGLAIDTDERDHGRHICEWALVPANLYAGRLDDARAAIRRLDDVLDREADPFMCALSAGGAVTIHLAEPNIAARYAATAIAVGAPLNNPTLDAWLDWADGCRSIANRHYEIARAHLEHSVALATETQNPHIEGMAVLALALTAGITRSPDAAILYSGALTRFRAARDWMNLWVTLEQLAIYWSRTGDLEAAAVIVGYLEARGTRYAPLARQRHQAVTAIHTTSEGQLWMARGAHMSREGIVDHALTELGDPAEPLSVPNDMP